MSASSRAASGSPRLSRDVVTDKSEPRLLREREAESGFALRLGKRIARRKKVRVQLLAAVSGVSEVADLVAASNARRTKSRPARTCLVPGKNAISKLQIGPGLETRQSASFNEVVAEPTEAIYVGAMSRRSAGRRPWTAFVGCYTKRRSCRARG